MTITKLIPTSETCGNQGVFIFVGQAGCQIGSSLWKLFNAEHSVDPNGIGLTGDLIKGDHICFYKDSIFYKEDEYHRRFCYHELHRTEKYVPRTLFIDLEPTVIDEIKTGSYKNLFSPDWSFHEYSKIGDGSGIFSRAYNTIGRCVISSVMNTIRHIIEKSDRLNVVNITRSYGGATGSGIGSLVLEGLHEQYPKLLLAESNILNSDDSSCHTIEPYNTLLGIESSCTSGGITFLYNNKALQQICCNKLRIKQPYFHQMNQLMSYGISGVYSSERFPGYGSCNMNSILTNLIPYPRIQLTVCSIAPIMSKKIMRYEPYQRPTEMIDNILSDTSAMFDINMETGSFISCCMLYRGIISPSNISKTHNTILNEKKMKFIEWSPRGIKSGHSPLGIVELPDFDLGVSQLSMTMLSNHTSISRSIAKGGHAANIMFKKKAFIHWYLEHGMEEEDFKSALENAMLLSLDYKEIETLPDKSVELLNPQSDYEIDESGKRIKKDKLKNIDIENVQLIYISPDKLLNVGGLNKKGYLNEGNVDSSIQSKVQLLMETSLLGGTEEENKDAMNSILDTMSKDDREKLISIAKSNGIDASFIKDFNDGNLVNVNLDELKNLSKLIEIADKSISSISLSAIDRSIHAKVSALLEEVQISGKDNVELNGAAMIEIMNGLSANDYKNLISTAKSKGVNVDFLIDLQNGKLVDINIDMIQNVNTIMEIMNQSTQSKCEISLADESTHKKLANLLEEVLNVGKDNEVFNIKSAVEIFNTITDEDRENLISMAISQGIDPKFLIDLNKGNITDFNDDMIQSFKVLLDLTDKSKTNSYMDYTDKSMQSLKSIPKIDKNVRVKVSELLGKALNNDEENEEVNKNVMLEIFAVLSVKDRENLISFAKANNIDASFLASLDEDNVIAMISDPNYHVDKEMLKTLNILLDKVNFAPFNVGYNIEFENAEIYGADRIDPLGPYEIAGKSIETSPMNVGKLKITSPQLLLALSTGKTYEESYVICIYPRTSLTSLKYFSQLHLKALTTSSVEISPEPKKYRCKKRE